MRPLAVTLTCIAVAANPSSIVAQQQKCGETKTPKRLPPPSALVDSARAVADLATFESPTGGMVFSLLFNDTDSFPSTRPLEGVAPQAGVVLLRALRPQKPAGVWAVRVRVVGGAAPALTLERSQYCPPIRRDRRGGEIPTQFRVQIQPGDRRPLANRPIRIAAEMMVTETGEVVTVRLLQPSGVREIDDEVTRMLQGWHFLPALIDGMPMEALYRTDGRSPKL